MYYDKTYLITREIYKKGLKNGLTRQVVRARVRRGWSVEDAITIPKKEAGRPRNLLTKEQLQIACNNGISVNTVYGRIRIGWSVEDAITKPIKKKRGYKI